MINKENNMPDDQLANLLKRYAEGCCSEEEALIVEAWFDKYKLADEPSKLQNQEKAELYDDILNRLENNGEFIEDDTKKKFRFNYILVIVSIAILSFLIWLLIFRPKS